MKFRCVIILLLVGQFCKANMSSPILYGTRTSAAFTNTNIHILSENITINIDKDFKFARFIVEYTIQSDSTGLQIPLLFYAQDYEDSFYVWVDNKRVNIQNIPDKFTSINHSPFSTFSSSFKNHYTSENTSEVSIYWDEHAGFVYKLNDLKYFETDIVKGIHKVRVEYIAKAWTDLSGWIKKYSFRYSLTPAKFWKSFGQLSISVEQEGEVKQLSTNIGTPIEKIFQSKNSWTFTTLPDDYLEFSFTPTTNKLAKAFIHIEPIGLSIITGIVLFSLHVWVVFRFRRQSIGKKYSKMVIVGSILIPFLILLSYIYSYQFIDHIIGEEQVDIMAIRF